MFGIDRLLNALFPSKKPVLNAGTTLSPRSSASNPERKLIKESLRAVGVSYYKKNIDKLACKNPDWAFTKAAIVKEHKENVRIFRYNYINKPVKLIKEPTNPHSKNAIQVIIAGELVGYIAESEVMHVHDILDNHEIKYISAFISGGDYKILVGDSLEHESKDLAVTITIGYV